jgi:hypothetical protein
MKNIVVCLFCFVGILPVNAQSLKQNSPQFKQNNENLMLGLGSWAVTNFIGSGIGWNQSESVRWKSFHQMNVFWNVVNAGLAIPGYIKAKKQPVFQDEAVFKKEQLKTERLFLFNSGLDLIYITSGALLMGTAHKKPETQERNLGFGQGIIVQGGFLLAFDATAYFVHRHLRIHGTSTKLSKLSIAPAGTGIRMSWSL